MDTDKFKSRILKKIGKSLPIQRLNFKPIELICHRDRYFMVRCLDSGKERDVVFLRWENAFYYLIGIDKIPREKTKRNYKSRKRGLEKESEALQRKQKQIIEKRIKQADSILKKVSKIVRQRS